MYLCMFIDRRFRFTKSYNYTGCLFSNYKLKHKDNVTNKHLTINKKERKVDNYIVNICTNNVILIATFSYNIAGHFEGENETIPFMEVSADIVWV